MYCPLCVGQESLRTPLNVGFMICFAFALAMQVLELGVLAGGNIAKFGGGLNGSAPSSEKAVTGFSVLLFLSYVRTVCACVHVCVCVLCVLFGYLFLAQ